MKSFILKTILLIIVLLIGVSIGMNQANQGMVNMKGHSEEQFLTPVTVQKGETGAIEASVLGKDVSSFSIDERKEKLEEIEAFNLFSEIGKFLAKLVNSIAETIYNFIAGFF